MATPDPASSPAGEQALIESTLRRFAAATRFPLVFGGLTTHDTTFVTAIRGNYAEGLRGLRVQTGRGLGGRAMAEQRTRITGDYATSDHITHDYDLQVLSERVRSLVAVPIVVDRRVRGVLYGGLRDLAEPGSIAIRPAAEVARELEQELRIRDEVARRLRDRSAEAADAGGMGAAQVEELRESFAELRSISSSVSDPDLLERLRKLERRIAGITGGADAEAAESRSSDAPHLSKRELDVLGYVALGCTNRETAIALGLTEGTVKSYLGAAMTKLESSTRHQAVATARKHGLLP